MFNHAVLVFVVVALDVDVVVILQLSKSVAAPVSGYNDKLLNVTCCVVISEETQNT